jgi:hypothetical protein
MVNSCYLFTLKIKSYPSNSRLIMTLSRRIQRPTHSPWRYPGCSRLRNKSFCYPKIRSRWGKGYLNCGSSWRRRTWAVRDLKISVNRFGTQISTLEDKIKHLENKVVDGLNEIWVREICLECTTRVNDDYLKQVAQLSKRLESKFFDCIWSVQLSLNHFLTNPALTHRIRCRA